ARILSQEPVLRSLFDSAVATVDGKKHAKPIASVLVNDLLGEMRSKKIDTVSFTGEAVAELVQLGQDGTISTKQAKDVLSEMVATGKRARAIVEEKGMK
ncbi:hypothetical protein, partial [Escherichia coli]|uniref:hypothetical protein n=1 Tax=Escherichia coli TaxID=562 RepID=UPI00178E1BDA